MNRILITILAALALAALLLGGNAADARAAGACLSVDPAVDLELATDSPAHVVPDPCWQSETEIGKYGGDDAYDPAAGGLPAKSLVADTGVSKPATARSYSGDDAYDPAAGGQPQRSLSGTRSAATPADDLEPETMARLATATYHRVSAAEEDGFEPLFECVGHPSDGAMGLHYINPDRFDAELDLTRPEALVYEPDNGRLRLVAVEYIVPAEAWADSEPPRFLDQSLEYKTKVGAHEVDPYYELHAWLWSYNPSGMYADWNPQASCLN